MPEPALDSNSPPGTKQSSGVIRKPQQPDGQPFRSIERGGSEPVDPSALNKALKDVEDAGWTRDRTPGSSPSRKRQRVYGDRLV